MSKSVRENAPGTLFHSRIRLSRAIGSNNGSEIGVTEEKRMMAFVGLEVYGGSATRSPVFCAG